MQEQESEWRTEAVLGPDSLYSGGQVYKEVISTPVIPFLKKKILKGVYNSSWRFSDLEDSALYYFIVQVLFISNGSHCPNINILNNFNKYCIG